MIVKQYRGRRETAAIDFDTRRLDEKAADASFETLNAVSDRNKNKCWQRLDAKFFQRRLSIAAA